MSAVAELKKEIAAREQELARLKAALAILDGSSERAPGPGAGAARKRRPKTAAEKARLSELARERHALRKAGQPLDDASGRTRKA